MIKQRMYQRIDHKTLWLYGFHSSRNHYRNFRSLLLWVLTAKNTICGEEFLSNTVWVVDTNSKHRIAQKGRSQITSRSLTKGLRRCYKCATRVRNGTTFTVPFPPTYTEPNRRNSSRYYFWLCVLPSYLKKV